MTSKSDIVRLYHAWGAADDAWGRAIKQAYPKQWPGDVRYTERGKGAPGSALRAAYDAHQVAQKAFYNAGGADWLMGKGTATAAHVAA